MTTEEHNSQRISSVLAIAEHQFADWLQTVTPEARIARIAEQADVKQFHEQMRIRDEQRAQQTATENEAAQQFLEPYVSAVRNALDGEPGIEVSVTYQRVLNTPTYIAFVGVTVTDVEGNWKDPRFFYNSNFSVNAETPFNTEQKIELAHPYDSALLAHPYNLTLSSVDKPTPQEVAKVFVGVFERWLLESMTERMKLEWVSAEEKA